MVLARLEMLGGLRYACRIEAARQAKDFFRNSSVLQRSCGCVTYSFMGAASVVMTGIPQQTGSRTMKPRPSMREGWMAASPSL